MIIWYREMYYKQSKQVDFHLLDLKSATEAESRYSRISIAIEILDHPLIETSPCSNCINIVYVW
jgi:hypothetical protein